MVSTEVDKKVVLGQDVERKKKFAKKRRSVQESKPVPSEATLPSEELEKLNINKQISSLPSSSNEYEFDTSDEEVIFNFNFR
jgi:hypothetical protein